MNNKYAVILAGGQGTRFWPLSRKNKPKQFLSIIGKGSLLQQTIRRIHSKVKSKNILIVTGERYQKDIKKQVSRFRIPSENILYEPSGKNTAASICWAAAKIHAQNPEGIMVVLPSDHFIKKEEAFLVLLDKAFERAQEDQCLVTLGIAPTRPATGYGYLQTVEFPKAKKALTAQGIYKVKRFKEKPSLALAKKYIKNKYYFWNSGMFIWRADIILSSVKKYLPQMYKLIGTKSSPAHVRRVWEKVQSVSIDYGIMEKADNVIAVKAADIGWSDLGSWESVKDIVKGDKTGNIMTWPAIAVETKNTFVKTDKRIVATIGLDNVIIIDTPDALLVCRKDLSEKVKDVYEICKHFRQAT